MPSKGFPTLPQRQKKAQNNGQEVPDAHPGPDKRQRYVDAAKVLELTGDWPTSLAIRFFGPSLMGSLAFAIDPLSRFVNSFRAISDEKRKVEKETQFTEFVIYGERETWEYSNYFVDDPTAYPERLLEHSRGPFQEDLLGFPVKSVSFLSDSVQSQRYKGQEFGTMEMLKDLHNEYQNRISETVWDDSKSYIENDPPYLLYDRQVTRTTFYYDGPIAFPVGNWCDQQSAERLLSVSKQVATDQLFKLLPRTLANKRLFNALYQITELKDLPQLFRGLDDLANFTRKLLSNPLTLDLRLDKILSGAYLTYLFGIKSVEQAIASYLALPAKLTKRINYLMAQNRKVSSGKAAVNFDDSNFTYVSPNYVTLQLPGFVRNSFVEKVSLNVNYDVRCVVNQTIQFPDIIAPKFNDKNYRDLMGLQPRVIDVYDAIPFTWLFDWYTGLGDYINMIESVTDDRFLINFGFMTVKMSPKYEHSGTFQIADRVSVYTQDTDTVETLSNIRKIPFYTKSSFTHTKRWSVSDLDGSKTADNKNGNLSDQQISILSALISKFT